MTPKINATPPRDTPEVCPYCTADARYLERVATGWFCRCCSKLIQTV